MGFNLRNHTSDASTLRLSFYAAAIALLAPLTMLAVSPDLRRDLSAMVDTGPINTKIVVTEKDTKCVYVANDGDEGFFYRSTERVMPGELQYVGRIGLEEARIYYFPPNFDDTKPAYYFLFAEGPEGNARRRDIYLFTKDGQFLVKGYAPFAGTESKDQAEIRITVDADGKMEPPEVDSPFSRDGSPEKFIGDVAIPGHPQVETARDRLRSIAVKVRKCLRRAAPK